MSHLKVWFIQIRGPFLILSPILVFLGTAVASRIASINPIHAFLLAIGVTQTHIAVNLYNELSDYHTGIDAQTKRTPFSGGSGMMQAGFTTPVEVRRAAIINIVCAGLIGVYFVMIHGWPLLIIMALGGVAIRFYTTHLTRWRLGEAVAGLTLGTGVILGVHYALTGILTREAFAMSIPPGILTTQLLFLNEFPDADVDKTGGRRHWVIELGKQKSAFLYVLMLGIVYVLIVFSPLMTRLPYSIWIALLTLPVAIRASRIVMTCHEDTEKLIPALGMNVIIVLLTDLLLGIGMMIT